MAVSQRLRGKSVKSTRKYDWREAIHHDSSRRPTFAKDTRFLPRVNRVFSKAKY